MHICCFVFFVVFERLPTKLSSSTERLEQDRGEGNQGGKVARHPRGPLPPQRLRDAGADFPRPPKITETNRIIHTSKKKM